MAKLNEGNDNLEGLEEEVSEQGNTTDAPNATQGVPGAANASNPTMHGGDQGDAYSYEEDAYSYVQQVHKTYMDYGELGFATKVLNAYMRWQGSGEPVEVLYNEIDKIADEYNALKSQPQQNIDTLKQAEEEFNNELERRIVGPVSEEIKNLRKARKEILGSSKRLKKLKDKAGEYNDIVENAFRSATEFVKNTTNRDSPTLQNIAYLLQKTTAEAYLKIADKRGKDVSGLEKQLEDLDNEEDVDKRMKSLYSIIKEAKQATGLYNPTGKKTNKVGAGKGVGKNIVYVPIEDVIPKGESTQAGLYVEEEKKLHTFKDYDEIVERGYTPKLAFKVPEELNKCEIVVDDKGKHYNVRPLKYKDRSVLLVTDYEVPKGYTARIASVGMRG